jgi:DNA processing protein
LRLADDIIKQGGLLISEYTKDSRPQIHYFPRRNRILAGLSKITIVISGALKSGTLITAQVALDEGREIYALPGNINQRLNQGPNSLIAGGANVLISADEILKKYNIDKKLETNKISFKNKLHAKIFTTLQTEPLTLEQLAKKLGKSPVTLNVSISELEIRDLIKVNRFNQIEIL